MKTEDLRAAIYARVSTLQRDVENQDSMPSDGRGLRANAETRGWQVTVFEGQRVATWRQFAERILPALDATVTVDGLRSVEVCGGLALPVEGVKAHETRVYFGEGLA